MKINSRKIENDPDKEEEVDGDPKQSITSGVSSLEESNHDEEIWEGHEERNMLVDSNKDSPLSQKGKEGKHSKDARDKTKQSKTYEREIGAKETEANGASSGNELKAQPEENVEQDKYKFSDTQDGKKNDAAVADACTSRDLEAQGEFFEFEREDEAEREKFPDDCYSFLSLHGPCSNPLFFGYGMSVFAFQASFLILMLISALDSDWSNKLDSDNPLDGVLPSSIAANASPYVKATQMISILCYVGFASYSLMDVVVAVETFPTFKDGATSCMVFSCVARGLQGFIAMLTALLLIVTSDNNFISELDDVAFEMALSGKYGAKLEDEAKRIQNLDLPKCMSQRHKNRRFLCTVGISSFILLSLASVVIYYQNNKDLWLTKTFRVEFEDEKLRDYSGCYEFDEDATKSINVFNRNMYRQYYESDDVLTFGYCIDQRRWILFKGEGDPCVAFKDNKMLAYSTKIQAFDVSTTFSEGWFSAAGTPLENMYFLEVNDNIKDLVCTSLNDGICNNENLNEAGDTGYRFDGGDCCSATCSHSNCGLGAATDPFGGMGNATGHGFPNCIDPDMVPITIRLGDITSGVSIDYVKKKYGEDEETIRWVMDEAAELEIINPTLTLKCGNKHVLIVDIDQMMTNGSETVSIEDGATCTIEVQNKTDQPVDNILFVDLTIFQGPIDDRNTRIIEMNSEFQNSASFATIQTCSFEKLSDYYTLNNIHSNRDYSLQALSWMSEESNGQNCHDEFFVDRFALIMMKFDGLAPPGFTLTETDPDSTPHCLWSYIDCTKRGSLSGIDIRDWDVDYIPTMIGMLSSLSSLELFGNEIADLPSEIGKLSSLTKLGMSE
ncbi:unnamed protein product [Pseudo-nitzschia multistriata]|uniref:Uncharacterized protein n=1 Tax=Pseudo-nitzschia multistriata TaxID=183589 RepID=A0A448ZM24_9STRA|nr:unnamed protein product [Pseudo-nitzschia multistriata]